MSTENQIIIYKCYCFLNLTKKEKTHVKVKPTYFGTAVGIELLYKSMNCALILNET